MQALTVKAKIKNKANELGFFYCGFSTADFLEEEAPKLESWLKNNHHGKMKYMENHFDKRLDPRLLVDDAKTVISLLFNYSTNESPYEDSSFKISKYAYGTDYHFVVKERLKDLYSYVNEIVGDVNGRFFVDSAPVMDRAWAKKSGLGWQGKNTNLIHPKEGSFFFIAELIIDYKIEPDGPIKDYCGNCTKCIDACPTDALFRPYEIDASRCISYLTIELKDELIPREFENKMDNWIFGCDICQDVCPWNKRAKNHDVIEFKPKPDLLGLTKNDWEDLDREMFNKLFKKSPVKRTGYKGLKRNISFLKNNRDK